MKFFCTNCGTEIKELQSPGEGISDAFYCATCAKDIDNFLTEAKKLHVEIEVMIKRLLKYH